MRIRTRTEYAATPAEVFAVLTNPDFVADTVIRMSVAGHSFHVEDTGRCTIVTTRRTLATAELPDIARKVAGPVLTVDEDQRWEVARANGDRDAELSLRIEGVPVSLHGTIRLSPADVGTIQVINAVLTARVPFVGGSIERAAAPAIEAGIAAEAALAREWLAG